MSHREFGQVFDQVAEEYDKARPGYPPSLVAVAAELLPGSRVLEIGSGTGKLTERLVARGLHVDAVEPGPNMIEAARRRIGETDAVTFHLGRFEDTELEGPYDGVFSGTAFHWVDPHVSWAKAASLLRPDGVLAQLTYVGVRDEQSADLESALHDVLVRYAPEVAEGWHPSLPLDELLAGARDRRANASAVWDWLTGERHRLTVPEAAELYRDVEVSAEPRRVEETADAMLAHWRTTSMYFRIAAERRAAFEEDARRVVERHGGTAGFPVADVVMTALRR